jgi:hypothetical protein
MTAIRSWVRRGLAANPPHDELAPTHEILWTAKLMYLKILRETVDDNYEYHVRTLVASGHWSDTSSIVRHIVWEPVTGVFAPRVPYGTSPPNAPRELLLNPVQLRDKESRVQNSDVSDSLVDTLTQLQGLMPDKNPLFELATNVARAMEQVLSLLERHSSVRVVRYVSELRPFAWSHYVSHGDSDLARLRLLRLDCVSSLYSGFQAPREQIYAILLLWLDTWENRESKERWQDERSSVHLSEAYLRFLGPSSRYPSCSLMALPRWIGKRLLLCPKPAGELTLDHKPMNCAGAPPWPIFGISVLLNDRYVPKRS